MANTIKPLTITQLGATGVSETLVTGQRSMINYSIVAANVDTNAVVRLEGSADGSNYGSMRQDTPASPTVAGGDITITEDGTYHYTMIGGMYNSARLRFVSESGGTAVTLDCVITACDH